MWSLGCVMVELCLLAPLLEGEDTGDQLAVMVDMFGVPSEEDILAMKVEDHVLVSTMRVMQTVSGADKMRSVLEEHSEICSVVSSVLRYNPASRATAARLTQHPGLTSLLPSNSP